MAKRKIYRYKGVPTNIFGLPILSDRGDDQKRIKISRGQYLRSFTSPIDGINDNLPKNLLVVYDIPHAKKKERDWFRRQLKKLDFIMIQKSVWVGPSPLPANFLTYIKMIGLEKEFKILELMKPYDKTI